MTSEREDEDDRPTKPKDSQALRSSALPETFASPPHPSGELRSPRRPPPPGGRWGLLPSRTRDFTPITPTSPLAGEVDPSRRRGAGGGNQHQLRNSQPDRVESYRHGATAGTPHPRRGEVGCAATGRGNHILPNSPTRQKIFFGENAKIRHWNTMRMKDLQTIHAPRETLFVPQSASPP